MGYEVLDASGHSVSEPARAGRAVDDVVDLGPSPDPSPPPVSRRPNGRRTSLIVLVSMAVGALTGTALTRSQNTKEQARSATSIVAVAAQATEVTPFTLPIGVGAQLQVVVTNLGPRSIDLVASDRTRSDTDQGTRQAVVTVLGVSTSLSPGTSGKVEMRVPVDCRAGRAITTTLPVRTADGAQHAVPVTLPDDGRPPATVCPRSPRVAALQATLTGPVVLPVLQLSNNTDSPMRVRLPLQALSPEGASSVIEVVTRPAMPTTIRPHDRLAVHLRFISHRCVGDLQDLQRLDVARLRVTPTVLTPGSAVDGEDVAVNVSSVVAAAMVRTCG